MEYEFSVLMSLYYKENEAYLEECLCSLKSQDLQPSEVVIVYDGYVSDELNDIVLKYKDELKINIVKLKDNVGLGKALNYGLQHCKYNYIARMDTDDVCFPNRFSTQIPIIYNSDIDILGSSVIEFDDEKTRFKDVPQSHEDIISAIVSKNPINHMSVVFKKDKIIEIGGYKHHLYMEDYNLWLRAVFNNLKIINLKDRLLYVRVNPEMVKRRKGLKYIKSEIELTKLKLSSETIPHGKVIIVSFVRIITRILPSRLLSVIYKVDRKYFRN